MQTFKVVFKRKESPIAYFSAMDTDIPSVEKIGFNKNNAIIPIPVVKGSHNRGKFRRWFAKEVIIRNLDQIKGEKDFSKRMAILTALFFSGSLTAGFKFKEENTFKIQKQLSEKDIFGRYFGYMITGLDNKRSSLLLGHLVPVIKDYNDDVNVDVETVDSSSFEVINLKLPSGKWINITKPLTVVLSSRKAPIINDVSDVIKETDEKIIEDLENLLSKQSKEEKEKKDVQNLLYFEVINSGFDLVQDIHIDSNDEVEIKGILTAYIKYYNEIDKTIGGLSARGFGHLDKVVVDGFTPDEEAFEEFIRKIDLKIITDLILYGN